MYVPVNPSESYPINRVLEDTTDVGTNYVQCKIYNAKTRALLATVNLTDNGNRWFSANYSIPLDNAFSNGTWLLVTTTVYTDSGYTTINTNYAQTSEQWLVQQRFDYRFLPQGLGPEWADKLDKSIKDAVEVIPRAFPKQKDPPPPVDTEALKNDIVGQLKNHIDTAISGIPTPDKPDKVDLRSLEQGISGLADLIKSRPQFERTDLSPVINATANLHNALVQHHTASQQSHEKTVQAIEENVKPVLEKTAHQQVLDGIKNGSITLSLDKPAEQQKKEGYLKGLAAKYKK